MNRHAHAIYPRIGLQSALPGWRQEGLLRLLENVLAVGEDPDNLVVYAALGKAARDWPSHDKIVETLRTMAEDETLIMQSGKPIGIIKTHDKAPIVIRANCKIVGQWAKAENFFAWQKRNLSAGAGRRRARRRSRHRRAAACGCRLALAMQRAESTGLAATVARGFAVIGAPALLFRMTMLLSPRRPMAA